MRKVSYSARALADIRSIVVYTKERWGSAQARRYRTGLETKCGEIAATPRIGRVVFEIDSELRSFPYQSHVIYYRLAGHGINVIAILHVRQDPGLRFSDNDA